MNPSMSFGIDLDRIATRQKEAAGTSRKLDLEGARRFGGAPWDLEVSPSEHARVKRSFVVNASGGRAALPGGPGWEVEPVDLHLPLVTPLSTVFPTQPDPEYVDIFLSVGKRENYGTTTDPATYRGCHAGNYRNCSLYKVRWNLRGGVPTNIYRLRTADSTDSYIQAALSPSEDQLAFVRQVGSSADASRKTSDHIEVAATSPAGIGSPVTRHSTRRRSDPFFPGFPEFYDENVVLFHDEYNNSITSGEGTLYAEDGSGAPPVPLLGPLSGTETNMQFQDAALRPSQFGEQSRALLSHGSHDIATDSALTGAGWEPDGPYPLMNTLTPSNIAGTPGTRWEYFVPPLRQDATSVTDWITECHHPDWNPKGNRVSCIQHGNPEKIPYLDPPAGLGHRALYVFERQGSGATASWQSPGLLFKMPSESDLETELGADVLPKHARDNSTPTCEIYHHKYAQWCKSENYIVATLYCFDMDYNTSADYNFTSRVVLIKIDQPEVEYWDITRAIRDRFFPGEDAINIEGIFPTCGTSRDSNVEGEFGAD